MILFETTMAIFTCLKCAEDSKAGAGYSLAETKSGTSADFLIE